MIKIYNKKNCCGCSACYNVCPKNCISMKADEEGFYYPVVNTLKCIDCGLCEKVCPMVNNTDSTNMSVAIGAYNKDISIRRESTSGGVFRILSQYVIDCGGVVFGAAFDDKFNVIHTFSETIEGCKQFSGSKYVQSDMNDCYSQARQFLKANRYVLFSGTPCQIAGLKIFLKKEYEKLITVDIVCHSVPSPYIWNKYKNIISNGRKIQDIKFRHKVLGNNSNMFYVQFDNGEQINEPYGENLYIKGFTKGLYSRPSCYSCRFSNLNRKSDFTLGDLWGVETIYPELENKWGTSLILLNTKKARSIFKCIKPNLKYKKIDVKKAIFFNPAINTSTEYNEYRENVFSGKDLIKSIKYYIENIPEKEKNDYSLSIIEKIKIRIINMIHKHK